MQWSQDLRCAGRPDETWRLFVVGLRREQGTTLAIATMSFLLGGSASLKLPASKCLREAATHSGYAQRLRAAATRGGFVLCLSGFAAVGSSGT